MTNALLSAYTKYSTNNLLMSNLKLSFLFQSIATSVNVLTPSHWYASKASKHHYVEPR